MESQEFQAPLIEVYFLSLFFVPFTDSGNTPKKAQIHRHKMNPMDKTKIWQRDFCDPSSPLRAMGIV